MTTIHKFHNDDINSEKTACGLHIVVDATLVRTVSPDARRVTCDNCQRARGSDGPTGE